MGDGEKLTLEPVGPEDDGFLRSVYAESRREELEQAVWPPGMLDAFLRMQFDAQYRHYSSAYPGALFLKILRDGHPVGRLYYHVGENELHVLDISLLPDARGKGIGGRLLTGIVDRARAEGRLVTIYVEKNNRAVNLYQRLGFQIAADEGVYWKLSCAAPTVSKTT